MAIVVVLRRKERRLFVEAASGVSFNFNCVVFADGLAGVDQAAAVNARERNKSMHRGVMVLVSWLRPPA